MDFDYIVVGAGAAGCVLANRLSADPRNRVLLVEAGVDTPPGREPAIILDPYPLSYGETDYMWPALRVEMKARGPRGAAPMSRHYEQGRVMGGGGSLMGMMALRGLPEDYDEWVTLGAAGWGWHDVLPYFKRLERDLDHGGPLHGDNGPVPIRHIVDKSDWPPFCRAVGEAIEARGYPFVADINADFRDGNGVVPMSSLPTQRMSSAIAYLDRDTRARRNLRILTDTTVEGLRWEGSRVVGIDARRNGAIESFSASEVVVAAGSLHSPAILMRAGIGPAAALSGLGIEVVADRPGVGANLLNHPVLYLAAHIKKSARQAGVSRPLTYNCFRHSSGIADCAPSDMFILISNRTSWHAAGGSIASLGIAAYKSYSRGSVTLASPDPGHEPRIRFNLLSDERDLRRIGDGLRLCRQLFESANVRPLTNDTFVPVKADLIRALSRPTAGNAFKARTLAALLDGPAVLRRRMIGAVGHASEEWMHDDAALREFVYQYTGAMFHPVGTCRIGPAKDHDAVVDPRCRVIGIEGLRVVDGSVMPTIIRGNTNLPIIMIAEKASEMILADCNRA